MVNELIKKIVCVYVITVSNFNQAFYLEKTLPYLYQIWGRRVHIETVIDSKGVVFSYNGEKISKKFL